MSLAEKIRKTRNQKGFSQNELAEKASVSLRTIQRIENGQTNPYGHTLKQIANALNVEVAEFSGDGEEIDFLKILNLSALALIIIPYSNLILPLIFYYKYRRYKTVAEVGKRIINFHLNWVIFCSVFLVGIPFIIYYLTPQLVNGKYPGVLLSYIIFVIYSLYRTLDAGRKIQSQKLDRVFPKVIRLF